MAEPYIIESLAGLALTDLVALVNRAYEGYPGAFSAEEPGGYAAFIRAQAIDLARSVLARAATGAPVGLGLLGIRGARGWCGEFGVLPAWRRQGVGRALLARLLAEARAAGLHDVRLEVATANVPAQRLYESAGFEVARTLHSFAAYPGWADRPRPAPPPGLRIAAADAAILAGDLGLPPDAAPAWDHELPALLVAGPGHTFLATHEGAPAGVLHSIADQDDVEIRRLGVRDADPAIAAALLAAAASRPAARLVCAYIAEASPLFTLLPALGFRPLAPDLEMAYRLADDAG